MRTPSISPTQAKSIQAIAALLCLATGSVMAGPTGSATVAANIDDVPLLAVGPVTAVDQEAGTITVNGQVFVLDDQTSIYLTPAAEDPVSVSEEDNLQEWDHVAIYGEIMEPGRSLATVISEIPEQFVAGASEGYVQVVLDANDSATAVALAGDTVIDYTAALANTELLESAAGDIVEFYGLAYDEVFIATDGYSTESAPSQDIADNSNSLAQRGSGVRAQRGSGVRAQRGSGVRAQRGSGVRAQRGSGVRAQRGSGVRAQRGSGVR